MSEKDRRDVASPKSTVGEIDAFLNAARRKPRGPVGRLIFALDATQSRQPTWDQACNLQAEMFREAASLGGLAIQLVFYRGFGECKASAWTSDSDELLRRMLRVRCEGGLTQIGKVLTNARRQAEKAPVAALVFVGDAFEEDIDQVCHKAGELGLLGVPVLMFQEGDDAAASRAFAEIAKLTGGAHCRFDPSSAEILRDLLRAAAAFAAGGYRALNDMRGAGANELRRALPAPGRTPGAKGKGGP